MTAPLRHKVFAAALAGRAVAPSPALTSAPAITASPAPAPLPAGSCLPHELPAVLDRYTGLKVLSLDCFDTLLWRDCHAPTDVFAALPVIEPLQRIAGEHRARTEARVMEGRNDVAIEAIYAAIMPHADARTRADAINHELVAEAGACHAFAPTVALMREARRRGLKVVIVSDTYLDSKALRALIACSAGDEVAGLIDRVFCSSTYGKPKAGGLYGEVLPQLKVGADAVLHIGDNHGADVGGVQPFGVHTVHLKQFAPPIAQQLRLESTVAALLFGHRDGEIAAPQPHRAALALGHPQRADPAQQLGHAVLGPLFAGFDAWLRGEAAELAATRGGQVHWLFLLRDGFLPLAVHQTSGTAGSVQAVEISRATATFASLTSEAALSRFLTEQITTSAPALARLLRLDDATVARITGGLDDVAARLALGDWCRAPANARTIIRAAQAMVAGMVAHVRNAVAPQPGDTLMLVDLGYNGTVQNLVAPILARAFKAHVAGRYLLLRETEVSGLDKRGYFDRHHFDFVTLNAFAGNVAVLEQLCTTAMGSVVDYAPDGAPIRVANTVKARQSATREAVQAGVLAYVGDAQDAVIRRAMPHAARRWREANAATMARLMYLPLAHELAVISAFEHDVNLGTDEMLALFDPTEARKGLRQKGLFYQKGTRRMYLPAELAGEGLALRLTHFATSRFASPLTYEDLMEAGREVAVIFAEAGGEVQVRVAARPTHDGFEALCIPLGRRRCPVAVLLGAFARHLEVASVSAMPVDDFLHSRGRMAAREVALTPLRDAITDLAPGLWQCERPSSFVLLAPPTDTLAGEDLVIVLVYRVIGAGQSDPGVGSLGRGSSGSA